MKTPQEMKTNALLYLQNGIDELGVQVESSERHVFHMMAQASLGTIKATGLITQEELIELGNAIGVANTKSSKQCMTREKRM